MSAAATAAGYLYASGRLRSRTTRGEEADSREPASRHNEQVPHRAEQAPRRGDPPPRRRREPLVGRVPPPARAHAEAAGDQASEKPRATPRIEYRTRRWRREG